MSNLSMHRNTGRNAKKIRNSEEYVEIYKSTWQISYKRGAITKAQSGQKLTKKYNLFVSIEIT